MNPAIAPQEFAPLAKDFQENKWVQFTPHYLVWVCPDSYHKSEECQSQCIRQGRYCTPDPDGDLAKGYSGADIVQVRTTLILSEQVSFESPSTILADSLPTRPRRRPRQGYLRCRHRTGAGYNCASGTSQSVSRLIPECLQNTPDLKGDLAKGTSSAVQVRALHPCMFAVHRKLAV